VTQRPIVVTTLDMSRMRGMGRSGAIFMKLLPPVPLAQSKAQRRGRKVHATSIARPGRALSYPPSFSYMAPLSSRRPGLRPVTGA